MSNALSTIIRSPIINLPQDSGCSKDDMRLVKMFLIKRNLRVKLGDILSDPIRISLGSFQGDSISAKFSLYIKGTLNHLKKYRTYRIHQCSARYCFRRAKCSNDCDHYHTNDTNLKVELFPQIKTMFEKRNLKVNEPKTEYVKIEMSEEKVEKGNEEWRRSKVHGSRIGSNEDIENRDKQGCAAFRRYKKCGWTMKVYPLKPKVCCMWS